MSEDARDILRRQSELETIRSHYEPVWQDIAEYCAPDAPDFLRNGFTRNSTENQAERSDRRSRRVYDTTIISAVDRLTAGLESLITPQSEKWHGFSTAALDDEETDEEKEWAENIRDFLFNVRYSAGANFVPAIQSCYQNVVRFGPAYLYAEESFDALLVRYSSIPVAEAYIARDRWGVVNTFHRRYERTALQAAQMFDGYAIPEKIRDMANDPGKRFQKVALVQSITKRDDGKRKRVRVRGRETYIDAPWTSVHVLEEENAIVKERGFRTFPVACFNWGRQDGDDYGTSPCIKALTTVRELNAVRKTGLRALQQVTDPALAGPAKLDYIPDLNPGSYNAGLMSDNGGMMVQPINTGQNPTYAFNYAKEQAEVVNNAMFVNLFQVLVQNPQMTATEALIRNEEKGSLLGPAGSVIQSGLAMLADRELSILEAKGLYEEGSRYIPPESLAGKDIRVNFTSPLDVLRRSAEARDTTMLVQTAGMFAQATQDPSVMDYIDADESLRIIRDAGRAPQRALRRREEVDQMRQQRAQAQQAQQGMVAMAQAASAAKDAVPALQQARDSGLMDGLADMMPAQ